MKILYIWHAAVVEEYRRRFHEFSKFEDVELKVLVPPQWTEGGKIVKYQKSKIDKDYEIIIGKIRQQDNIKLYLFLNNYFKLLKSFKPDVIHLVEEPFSYLALQTLIFKKLVSRKSKVIFHSAHNVSERMAYNFNFIRRLSYLFFDGAVVRNRETHNIIKKQGFTKPVKLSGNGISLENFKKVNSKKLKKHLGLTAKNIIGYFGRIEQPKGIQFLIEACSRLKEDYQILMIGSGQYKKEIEQLIMKFNLNEKIIWLDFIPHEIIAEYYNCVDVVVVPSMTTSFWKESFGRVIIEAMACEVPVIGSSSGAIPDVIDDYGIIFDEQNVDDLFDKLQNLLNDKKLRLQIGKKGVERAKDFSWENIAKIDYDFCLELLNKK